MFEMHPGIRVLWGEFSTACNSASITSVVSKRQKTEKSRSGQSQASVVAGEDSHVEFGQKKSLVKKEV
jgi:hypothetical protein